MDNFNISNTSIAKITDKAFNIYSRKFTKQFLFTLILNALAFISIIFVLWFGFDVAVPFLTLKTGNGIVTGLYAILFISIILIITVVFFRFSISSINIVIAEHNSTISHIAFIFIKKIGNIVSVTTAFLLIYTPVVFLLSFIVIKSLGTQSILKLLISLDTSQLNLLLVVALFLFCFIILAFMNTVFLLALPIAVLENKHFIYPLKQSFLIATDPQNLFKFIGLNTLRGIVSITYCTVIYLFVSAFFTLPNFLINIPYPFYILLLYRFFITYLFSILITPFLENILYSLYNPLWHENKKKAGIGSRLLSNVIDIFAESIVIAFVFTSILMFLFFQNPGLSFTLDLPIEVTIVVALVFIAVLCIIKIAYEKFNHGLSLGKKLMGLDVCFRNGKRIVVYKQNF